MLIGQQIRTQFIRRRIGGSASISSVIAGVAVNMNSGSVKYPSGYAPFRLPAVVSSSRRSYISLPDVLLDDDDFKNLPSTIGALPIAQMVRGRYLSPWSRKTEKTPWAVIQWLLTRKQEKLKFPKDLSSSIDQVLNRIPLDEALIARKDKLHFSWLGHATCFFQSGGLYFITDPVLFSQRVSPFQFLGPKRIMTPNLEEIERVLLSRLDVVLLSHTHYDHLDYATALRIGNRPLWVVPLGVKELLQGWGITNVVELNWWDKHRIQVPVAAGAAATPGDDTGAGCASRNSQTDSDAERASSGTAANEVEIVFTPTKHWTSRTPFDRNTCLWGSYVVASQHGRVFFGGDSAYCSVFKQIGELYGPFDVAALSIGAYKPRWFMKDVHCNPEEAVQMHLDLRSKRSVGIHWGTFPLADEDDIEPALELAVHRERRGVGVHGFHTMGMGETILPVSGVERATAASEAGTEAAASAQNVLELPLHDVATLHPALMQHYVEHCATIERKQAAKSKAKKGGNTTNEMKSADANAEPGQSGSGEITNSAATSAPNEATIAATSGSAESAGSVDKGRVIVGQEPRSASFTAPATIVPPTAQQPESTSPGSSASAGSKQQRYTASAP